MEDVKKLDEAAKSEELAERTPLTDEELDQASGGGTGVILCGTGGKKLELAVGYRACGELT